MHDDSFADSIAHALAGLAPDALEPIIDALADVAPELGTLSHDDIVKLVGSAIAGASGAATKHFLSAHGDVLDAAIRRALAAG